MEIYESLIWTGLLIFINAYFVICEIVLLTIRKTKLQEDARRDPRRTRLVKIALKHLMLFLPTIQVGVTLTSIALGLIGSPWLAMFLGSILPVPFDYLAFISFLVLTYFQLVFGELLPKTLALRRPEKYSLWVIPPLFIFVGLFWPLTWLVNMSTQGITKLFGIKKISLDRPYSEQEIKMIMTNSGKVGELSIVEIEMAYNVFKLKRIKVDQIMRPRGELISFDHDLTLAKVKEKIAKWRVTYNRYPIYKKTQNDIIGFFHITDLYRRNTRQAELNSLSQSGIIRKVLYAHKDETAQKVMARMILKRIYLTIVQNDDKKSLGIVSLTDIIDRVVKNSKNHSTGIKA